MSYNELEMIFYLSEEEQARNIVDIARRADSLDLFLSALKSQKKHLWKIALQGIRVVGYPYNGEALVSVLRFAADTNAPGWEEAIQILTDADPYEVIPLLVAYLLDRTRHEYWADDIEGICTVLDIIDTAYAKACGPALAYLLGSKEEILNNLDRGYLLAVLEKIGLGCADYTLPTLFGLLEKEGEGPLKNRIRRFIQSFSKHQLNTYSHLLIKFNIIEA